VDSRARVKRDLGLSWQIGVVLLVAVSYVLRDAPWRALALVFLPSIAAAIALRNVPESPRWLLANGRSDEALDALQHVAETNQRAAPAGSPSPPLTSYGLLEPSDRTDGDGAAATGDSAAADAESDTGGTAASAAADGEGTKLLGGGAKPVSAAVRAKPVGLGALFSSKQQATITASLTALSFVSSGTYYGLTFAPGAATGVTDIYAAQLFATLLEVQSHHLTWHAPALLSLQLQP
jgi:hypothetical protein